MTEILLKRGENRKAFQPSTHHGLLFMKANTFYIDVSELGKVLYLLDPTEITEYIFKTPCIVYGILVSPGA